MQIRESQATLKETCEFTFLPAFQKKIMLHSGSGKWSKIRDDNRAKILCQLKKRGGADVNLGNHNVSKPFQPWGMNESH